MSGEFKNAPRGLGLLGIGRFKRVGRPFEQVALFVIKAPVFDWRLCTTHN